MKKILMILTVSLLAIGLAYAQAGPTDEDDKNMEQLSKKLVRMKRDIDKFAKELAATYTSQDDLLLKDLGQDVRVDVIENQNDIIVRADLPGMDKDKIEITLENNKLLKIAGSREQVKKEASPGVVRQERMQGRFERTLELPVECKGEGIKATYKNGVLEISIPKKEKSKAEEVRIKVQ